MKITICIPTYRRPELLQEAIASCLGQTCQDFLILVGDDSPDDRTSEFIEAHPNRDRIEYVHNQPSLGQAANVNSLFKRCRTDYLLLLHDDDLLMPNCLEDLLKPLEQDGALVASFGKQYLMTHEGTLLVQESEQVNAKYFRTVDRENSVQDPMWSAVTQQFPNNAYLIRTTAAQQILYRSTPEVGQACDADFGFRLAALGRPFFLVGQYTAAYRMTQQSVSSDGLKILVSRCYFLLKRLEIPVNAQEARRKRLREMAPVAATGCLLAGERRKCISVLLSEDYGVRNWLSVAGFVRCLFLVLPKLAVVQFEMLRNRAVQKPVQTRTAEV